MQIGAFVRFEKSLSENAKHCVELMELTVESQRIKLAKGKNIKGKSARREKVM